MSASEVHPATASPAVEIGALLFQESGLADVPAPILDVVSVWATLRSPHTSTCPPCSRASRESAQPPGHGIQEAVFLRLPLGLRLAGVHVDRHETQRPDCGLSSGLHPAAGVGELPGSRSGCGYQSVDSWRRRPPPLAQLPNLAREPGANHRGRRRRARPATAHPSPVLPAAVVHPSRLQRTAGGHPGDGRPGSR